MIHTGKLAATWEAMIARKPAAHGRDKARERRPDGEGGKRERTRTLLRIDSVHREPQSHRPGRGVEAEVRCRCRGTLYMMDVLGSQRTPMRRISLPHPPACPAVASPGLPAAAAREVT